MKSLEEFKKGYILETELGIDASFGRILSIIDFGNVNYWFSEDRQSAQNRPLGASEKLRINLDGLYCLTSLFSTETRFYYGHDPKNVRFISAVKKVFGKRVFTKPIQRIKHYLNSEDELRSNTRNRFFDKGGDYVHIPKCNFDVEIVVDAIRLIDKYDTLALFSSDADFISLIRYLKGCGKKTILFKNAYITQELRGAVSKVINAQQIKKHIVETIMQKPGI